MTTLELQIERAVLTLKEHCDSVYVTAIVQNDDKTTTKNSQYNGDPFSVMGAIQCDFIRMSQNKPLGLDERSE